MNRNQNIRSSRWVALLLLLFMLSACGQKGDLYLPPDPEEVSTLTIDYSTST